MTLEEMERCDREYLIPREVAEVLGCAPYSINIMAKQCPDQLGFGVVMIGRRVKIPRRPFIKFMTEGCPVGVFSQANRAGNT